MRTVDTIKKHYREDYDYQRFIDMHEPELAVYILFSHLDDSLRMINEKIDSLLDSSQYQQTNKKDNIK